MKLELEIKKLEIADSSDDIELYAALVTDPVGEMSVNLREQSLDVLLSRVSEKVKERFESVYNPK